MPGKFTGGDIWETLRFSQGNVATRCPMAWHTQSCIKGLLRLCSGKAAAEFTGCLLDKPAAFANARRQLKATLIKVHR